MNTKIINLLLAGVLLAACEGKQGRVPDNKSADGSKKMLKEKWHWGDSAKQSVSAGYAQVVKVGNVLYLSGVPTADTSGKGVEDVYRGLERSLKAYGAGFENVVKENLYATDIELMKRLNEFRKKFYNNDFPAATWVQISRLYEKDAWLEVDLVAVLLE